MDVRSYDTALRDLQCKLESESSSHVLPVCRSPCSSAPPAASIIAARATATIIAGTAKSVAVKQLVGRIGLYAERVAVQVAHVDDV